MAGRKKKTKAAAPKSVLITGAAGYIGGIVTKKLAADRRGIETIVASDVRAVPPAERVDGVTYITLDVRSHEVASTIEEHKIDVVVHLAAIVTPPKGMTRDDLYAIEVLGTRNLLDACVEHGVKKFIVSSSGAAYGYHPDNPPWLTEDDPLRGNEAFAYSHHKRLVENMLADYRHAHPELGQLILRPGTVLGRGVSNQITAIFERPAVIGLMGAATPFVFIWDEDVAAIVCEGVHGEQTGAYNLAGDGAMTLKEIARVLKKPYVPLPVPLVRGALTVLSRLGLAPYGPEQVMFLQYRPVLANDRLKREFGYVPKLSSRQVFDLYRGVA